VWLGTVIAEEEAQQESLEVPSKPRRKVLEQQRMGQVVYQLEGVRCGKPK